MRGAPIQASRRSLSATRAAGASRVTVLVALAANGLIAVAKLLVAARVDLADGVVAEQLEHTMSDLDDAIRDAVPDVTEVFLDPTPAREAY